MTETWLLATLWLGLALIATLLSIWLGIATVLFEIVVGTVAQLVIGALGDGAVLGANAPWDKMHERADWNDANRGLFPGACRTPGRVLSYAHCPVVVVR